MKKVFLAILISVLCFIPFSVNAEEKEYKTLNLDEALKEEKIDHDFSNYKETDDQAIIYLFRGKGCAYCKKFLTYLNSIFIICIAYSKGAIALKLLYTIYCSIYS